MKVAGVLPDVTAWNHVRTVTAFRRAELMLIGLLHDRSPHRHAHEQPAS